MEESPSEGVANESREDSEEAAEGNAQRERPDRGRVDEAIETGVETDRCLICCWSERVTSSKEDDAGRTLRVWVAAAEFKGSVEVWAAAPAPNASRSRVEDAAVFIVDEAARSPSSGSGML